MPELRLKIYRENKKKTNSFSKCGGEGNQYFTHINRVPQSTCKRHLVEETKIKKGKRETGNRLTDIRRTIQTQNTR
jgi:hypothetical protein